MTGFAAATAGAAGEGAPSVARGGWQVELRSVNGRFLDVAFRMPDAARATEPALRRKLVDALKRGKVDVRVTDLRNAEATLAAPAVDKLMQLARHEATVRAWLPQARPLSVQEALAAARAGVGGADSAASLDDAQQADLLAAADAAIAALQRARAREGARLADVLRARIADLRGLVAQAAPLVPQAVQRQQARFLERWREALDALDGRTALAPEAAQERALAEAASQALRIDVGEELARLTAHLDEVERLLDKGGELGKRLDFLVQELHREANTLGSKSASLELTAVAVEMKVAVEQMREQVQNLE